MAIRQSLKTPTKMKAAVGRPNSNQPKPKATRGRKPGVAKVNTSDSPALANGSNLADLQKQLEIQQQALATQAWMANEISHLRLQLAQKSLVVSVNGSSSDSSALLAEVEALRNENAALNEKANRLNQMASLFDNESVPASEQKPRGRVPNAAKSGISRVPEAAIVAKVPGRRGRKPGIAKSLIDTDTPSARKYVKAPYGSLWQTAADADVKRTYKSCWPVVFKIEEWNQNNPGRLAKISQTMLNKSGVNFSRAKGFIDTYALEVQQYHDQIGLNKANSGKFNEVYEFIRASLGKGRK
jgi:hypothetical protein